MRLTGLGKFVILILAIGLAIGGYRVWSAGQKGAPAGTTGTTGTRTPGGFSGGPQGDPQGGSQASATQAAPPEAASQATTPPMASDPGAQQSPNGAASASENASAVTLVTSKSGRGWLTTQIEKFNARGGSMKVVPEFVETREAMHGILDGTLKPVLYAPSTTVWAQRLRSSWKQKSGLEILNPGDTSSYRVYLKTPLVFVTTRDKARFLRPLLGRPGGWQKLHDLGAGRIKPPWGKWQWSHADPLTANSGTMTLGAILADFANASAQDDYGAVARSQKFRSYVRELERGLKFDLPAQSGSSALFSAFLKEPGRYDCITAYESVALSAASSNPNLAVIYPQPTVVSESVAALLSAPWVSEEQKKVGQEFLAFLGSPESIADGVREGLRPISTSDEAQSARLASLRPQGFSSTYTATELPPYEALNAVAFNWRGDVSARF